MDEHRGDPPEAPATNDQSQRRDDARWSHVDPGHPRPWEGCIRRGLCCQSSPGWFAPGEAEAAARHVGMDMGEFVNTYLVVDRLDTTAGRIEVFAPVKLAPDGSPAAEPGTRVDGLYHLGRGPCVFYDPEAKGCRIYPARPLECRLYSCTNLPEDNPRKLDIALLWLRAARGMPTPEAVDTTEELRRLAAETIQGRVGDSTS